MCICISSLFPRNNSYYIHVSLPHKRNIMMTKKKKRVYIRGILLLVVLVAVFCFIRYEAGDKYVGPKVCTSTTCFKVEIADTPKTREIWLMNRTSLEKDRGMLFVFQAPGIFAFWMKNTLIPLDMLRMDQNYKIVYIQNSAQPCTADPCPSYNPWTQANYVLEIKWWVAEELGVKVGDSMEFRK